MANDFLELALKLVILANLLGLMRAIYHDTLGDDDDEP